MIAFLFAGCAVASAGPAFVIASVDPLSLSGILCTLGGAVILAILAATLGRWCYRRIRRLWMRRGTWTHRWRMQQLAVENRLNYIPVSGDLALVGTVLQTAGRGHWDTFRVLGGRFCMFGNVLPHGRAAEDRAPDGWGFFAVHLDAHVPHLLLTPRERTIAVRPPLVSIAGSQKLALDGEFDRHFELSAPAGYTRDPLQVITPDLMTLLIDRLPGSIVETHDNLLVVTTPEPYDFAHSAAWEQMNLLLDTVIPKPRP